MVDNRAIGPMSNIGFKADNAMANKMSDEKQGQGGEYFNQEIEENQEDKPQESYQDRSAQLRASLNGLAMANAGSIMFMKTLKKKEFEKRIKEKYKPKKDETEDKEEITQD